jgi:hypothetical protein
MSSGMWAPENPERPEMANGWNKRFERLMDRHPFVFLGVFAVIFVWAGLAKPESTWGRLVLGAIGAVFWFIGRAYELVDAVPPWAWLIIIPLFGIWRRVAAMDERAREQKREP